MAKVTGLEERRKLIKDAKATEVRKATLYLVYAIAFLCWQPNFAQAGFFLFSLLWSPFLLLYHVMHFSAVVLSSESVVGAQC